MAIGAGTDYAIARSTLWVFAPTNIASVTAVLTRSALYLFPRDGVPGIAAIDAMLAAPEMNAQALDGQLAAWRENSRGAAMEPLAKYHRVRIFTGWLRRSVAFSTQDTGYDLRASSIKPSKLELPAFVELLRGHPRLELK